jgi:hypothetical protein
MVPAAAPHRNPAPGQHTGAATIKWKYWRGYSTANRAFPPIPNSKSSLILNPEFLIVQDATPQAGQPAHFMDFRSKRSRGNAGTRDVRASPDFSCHSKLSRKNTFTHEKSGLA